MSIDNTAETAEPSQDQQRQIDQWTLYHAVCQAFAEEYGVPNILDEFQGDREYPRVSDKTLMFMSLFIGSPELGAVGYSRQDMIGELHAYVYGFNQNEEYPISRKGRVKSWIVPGAGAKIERVLEAFEKGKQSRPKVTEILARPQADASR